LTLYVLYELVLFMLKLDFEKLINVVIFLYEGLLSRGLCEVKKSMIIQQG
jgi:hypothetical protein